MKRNLTACVATFFLLCVAQAVLAQGPESGKDSTYPGKVGEWCGFELHDFTFEGRAAKLVFPKDSAPGKPWVWRARFFGHEPQFDVAMLERGFTVAWLDSTPLMGSPKSVELWQRFYSYLVAEFGLHKKATLEGMSRGGLYATMWAFAYPDEVACLYLDNPVMDFKSWPGGFGHGKRSDKDWNDVLSSYGLTEEEARAFKDNPIDNQSGCEALAKRRVGFLFVCGDSDTVVPGDENWRPFKNRYEACGGYVEAIVKQNNDHHPHSLKDPTPIVLFALKFNEMPTPENVEVEE